MRVVLCTISTPNLILVIQCIHVESCFVSYIRNQTLCINDLFPDRVTTIRWLAKFFASAVAASWLLGSLGGMDYRPFDKQTNKRKLTSISKTYDIDQKKNACGDRAGLKKNVSVDRVALISC